MQACSSCHQHCNEGRPLLLCADLQLLGMRHVHPTFASAKLRIELKKPMNSGNCIMMEPRLLAGLHLYSAHTSARRA